MGPTAPMSASPVSAAGSESAALRARELSAARRPGALEVCDKTSDVPIDPDEMPAEWSETAIRAGAALGLDLFGVDLLIRNGRPFVIDVNAFPGFRGARDPAASMLRFLERHTTATVVH